MLKRLDMWHVLVIILAFVAALPLLRHMGLPNGSDVLYHTYRVGEMARSWEHGMPFPRWAEGLYYGYGSPLWNFYASLTYYTTTLLVRYLGFSALDALRVLLVLMYLGMGSGMYLFTRQQANKVAGVLAATAYMYAPYMLFTEPYARGTYPEMLAFALFPLVMWRFGGVLRLPNGVNMAAATVLLYLLAVSHNLMAILLSGILVAWLVWNAVATWLSARAAWRHSLRSYGLALVCVLLGIGLSGYFWLPVVMESGTVNLQNLTGVSLLDYRNFFVPLPELLAPMPLNDLGAINGLRNVYSLGIAQWLGAIAGFTAVSLSIQATLRAGKHDDPLLRQGVFFALVSLVLLFFILPASSGIWDGVRGLQFLQFPWRLLGGMAFSLAFLVGMNALWIQKLSARSGGIAAGLGVALLVITGVPALTVPEWSNTSVDTSIAAYHQSEVSGLQRGTTFTDEFRPRTVYTLPDAVPSLLADYADGVPINKAHVPADVQATPTLYSPVWLEWLVVTPRDFQMEVYTFYWEGWRASIDDQVVDITPSAEHGLITFEVPPGTHTVRVFLGTTPPRLAGNFISLISLLSLLAIIAGRINNTQGWVSVPTIAQQVPSVGLMLGGAAIAVGLALINPVNIFYRDTPVGSAPASVQTDYRLDSSIGLIGYDINSMVFRAGDTVELVVYWFPRETATVDFSSFVHIGIAGQPPLAQADKMHPADRKMTQWWQPTGYLYDAYRIKLPPDMPPGNYEVLVGMYTCEGTPANACGNGIRPVVTDASGTVLADVVPLVAISVP